MVQHADLIIHIGTHKTGTTSIQQFLESHKDTLYSSEDINFLDLNIPKKFEIPFATKYDKAILNEIKSYLEENTEKEKTNVISHEGFSGNPMEFYSNYQVPAKMLYDATADFNRKIVVFFRRQDLFIQSCFMQYKSRGHKFDFSEFYDRKKMENLNWFSMANYYADLFGRDRIEVQLYNSNPLADKKLINIFGERIGSKMMAASKKQPTENVGLSVEALEVFEKISSFLSTDEKKILKLALQKNFNRGFGARYNYLSDDEVSYINNFFSESNQKLAEIYCGEVSFSDAKNMLNNPRTFTKHRIYLQLILDLIKNESRLNSKKRAMLKSYLYSTKSSIIKWIRNESK